jgi:hypothetical protein
MLQPIFNASGVGGCLARLLGVARLEPMGLQTNLSGVRACEDQHGHQAGDVRRERRLRSANVK